VVEMRDSPRVFLLREAGNCERTGEKTQSCCVPEHGFRPLFEFDLWIVDRGWADLGTVLAARSRTHQQRVNRSRIDEESVAKVVPQPGSPEQACSAKPIGESLRRP